MTKSISVPVKIRKIKRQLAQHVVNEATLSNINMLTRNFMDENTVEAFTDLVHDQQLQIMKDCVLVRQPQVYSS